MSVAQRVQYARHPKAATAETDDPAYLKVHCPPSRRLQSQFFPVQVRVHHGVV